MTRVDKLSGTLLFVFLSCGIAFAGASRTRPVRVTKPIPTFNKEVSRIFQQHCQSCHRPEEVAPFSLLTYQDAKPHAALIGYMVSEEKMPPWKAAEGCGEFTAERKLSAAEIATIQDWVRSGAPEGDPRDLPAPLTFQSDWTLGKPDFTLRTPVFQTPAHKDTYRCFPVTGPGDARFISAIDVRPGNREITHHVIAYLDTTGASAALDAKDIAPGYECFGGPGFTTTGTLGGWAPGARAAFLPDGIAMSLPAQTTVVLQVHYHPQDDLPASDQTEVGIYYSKVPVRQQLRVLPLINNTFVLTAGDPKKEVTTSLRIPSFVSAQAWNISPHMHLLGRRLKVEATLPNGQTNCMINIEDWDFNWQGTYQYARPQPLPAGTLLTLRAEYDNSSGNPRNPNKPPKDVRWGEETTDEMCIAFIGFTIDGENLLQGKTVATDWIPPLF